MKEIGGYIEFEKYRLPMLHEGAIALNCGRNCLAYLLSVKKISRIALPYFLCDTVKDICESKVQVRYYHIDSKFLPVDFELIDDEWLYLVNYYGQLSETEIIECRKQYGKVILDQAHAYFAPPIEGLDTIYTCRKFLGVPDGAFLYTDCVKLDDLERDESYERLNFLAGRFERTAAEFYTAYSENEAMFDNIPIKRMSKLTDNLLHGIDYDNVKLRRTINYEYLCDQLSDVNKLEVKKIDGAFAYPLLVDEGDRVRRVLIENKIYIPRLWPNVLREVEKSSLEYMFAENILPIPCDQRYDLTDMEWVCRILKENL